MTEPYFDKKDQYDRIQAMVIPGETVQMVLDCKGSGTGFVGITNKRLIFQDQSWRRTKNVLVSVPFDRVHAVGLGANIGMFTSSGILSIQAGEDDWAFEFRNQAKAKRAYQTIMLFVLNRDTNTPDTPLPELPAE